MTSRPCPLCTSPSAPLALRRTRTCRNQIYPPVRPRKMTPHVPAGEATPEVLLHPRPPRRRCCLRRRSAANGARAARSRSNTVPPALFDSTARGCSPKRRSIRPRAYSTWTIASLIRLPSGMATLATLDSFPSFTINRSNPRLTLTEVALLADSTVSSAWLTTNAYCEIRGGPAAMGQRRSKARPSAAKRDVACPPQWLPVLLTTALPAALVQYTPDQADWSTAQSKLLSKPPPTSPSPLVCATNEAEDATASGVSVSRAHDGYNGTGFMNFYAKLDGYLEWTIAVHSATTVPVRWRYALINGNRRLRLSVNGEVVQEAMDFPASGGWSTWISTVDVPLTLSSGSNTVRLTSIGGEGANIDSMHWCGPAGPPPSPPPPSPSP
eukprot:scaffold48384_cov56-Phaeocystis_antarctica.AAC.3